MSETTTPCVHGQYAGTCSHCIRQGAAPSSAASERREEWVVEYLTEHRPRWVEDGSCPTRAEAEREAKDLAIVSGRPVRLVHVVTTRSVVEAPADAD